MRSTFRIQRVLLLTIPCLTAIFWANALAQEFAGEEETPAPINCNDLDDRFLSYDVQRRDEENYRKAVEDTRKDLESIEAACGKASLAYAELLGHMGWLQVRAADFEDAEDTFREAIRLAREAPGDKISILGLIMQNRTILYLEMERLADAEASALETIEIRKLQTGPVQAEQILRSRSLLAIAYDIQGRPDKALPVFQEIVDFYEESPRHPDFGKALNNLGMTQSRLGDYETASVTLQRAINMQETKLGSDSVWLTNPLRNRAYASYQMGDYDTAEAMMHRVVNLQRIRLGEGHPDIGKALTDLGELLFTVGRFHDALDVYSEALGIAETAFDDEHPQLSTSLGHIAAAHVAMGSYETALPLIERAIEVHTRTLGVEHPDRAHFLRVLAYIYSGLGRSEEAISLLNDARERMTKVLGDEHHALAEMYNALGLALRGAGKRDEALSAYRDALRIAEKALGESHPDIAALLAEIAAIQVQTEQFDHSAANISRAWSILAEQPGNLPTTARVTSVASRLASATGNVELAVFHGKHAVNAVQRLRAAAAGTDPVLQRSFITSKTDIYRHVADLLISAGRLTEAQQVMAMLKEEEYFDFVRRRSGNQLDTVAPFAVLEAPWVERYDEISGRLVAIAEELDTLKHRRNVEQSMGRTLTPEESARLDELTADQQVARQAFLHFQAELREYFIGVGGERLAEFAQKDLESLGAVQAVLRRLERSSGERVTLLTYLVTDDRLRIVLTTPRVQAHRDSDIAAADLNRLVFEFRDALQDPRRDAVAEGRALHAAVLAPVSSDLEEGNTTALLVSLDQALRYVPFAALHDGEKFVAERFAVSVFTPAARLSLERTPQETWRAAGMGVTEPDEAYRPLPAVRLELDRIVREPGLRGGAADDGVLIGRTWLDQDFTASALSGALDDGYPVVHLASHFVFKPGTEQDSFLLLGDGTHLSLAALVVGDYPFDQLDLLTLSACETALGGQEANGREIEGFGALAQKQGASAVLATLWPVADASTAEFMARFYEYRQVHGLSKAQALVATQRDFIAGLPAINERVGIARGLIADVAVAAPEAAAASQLDHPYYWAPFILMGNWQ